MTEETHPADEAMEEVLQDLMYSTAYDAESGRRAADAMARKWKEAHP